MRVLKFLLVKEFKQIFRNRIILAMSIMMPVVQLILLPLAADYEIKNINIVVVDNDRSSSSDDLIDMVISSGYFNLVDYQDSFDKAAEYVENDEADMVLEIPNSFDREILSVGGAKLMVAVDAVNGMKAVVGASYLQQIILDFNREINLQFKGGSIPSADISTLNLYNPQLNYRTYMVPGILAMLVTMITCFLTVLNIVKEKEQGTIEQINVTPVKKHHFVLGKLIPMGVVGNVVFTLGLLIARYVYGIEVVGSISLLYGVLQLYLIAILGLSFLISTFCDTQQQAMLICFFFIMIFTLLGGLFTSIDSMPNWSQYLARATPTSHMVEIMRMIILKGSSFFDITKQILSILLFAIIFNTFAVINYKKRT